MDRSGVIPGVEGRIDFENGDKRGARVSEVHEG